MIRPEFEKWGQSPEEILALSISAEHPRTRERFQALYLIGTGKTNATRWAEEIKRRDQTVMDWIHRYNAQGPESLIYKKTGGRRSHFA